MSDETNDNYSTNIEDGNNNPDVTISRVKGKHEEKDKLYAVINENGKPVGAFVAKQPYAFEEWVAMNQEARKTIAMNSELRGEDLRVLFYIEGILDYENHIPLSTAEIARDLNMRQSNVSRAFKNLQEHQLIIKGPKVGRCNSYVLNAWVGFKGKAKNHRKVIKRHLRLVDTATGAQYDAGEVETTLA